MNAIDVLFGTNNPMEFVCNVIFGFVLAWIAPHVNTLLKELSDRGLYKDGFFNRLTIYTLVSLPFVIVMSVLGIRTRLFTCLGSVLIVMIFIRRDKAIRRVQPIVKWVLMRKYKNLMTPSTVWYTIKSSRNKYCLQEWLDDGWKLPNGSLLCEDRERFKKDLAKSISECTTEGLEDWQVQMVCECGYKFRNTQ